MKRRNAPSRVRSKSELSARRACVVSVPLPMRGGSLPYPLSPAEEGMPRKGVCEEWRHKWLSSAQTSGYSVLGYYFGSALLGFHCVFLCVNIGAYLIYCVQV